jgi:CDP-diacylglycerol--serine O-phosphatidyltransferase
MSDNKIKYFTVPNIITLLNLLSGTVAIMYAFENPSKLIYASYLIGFSMMFDFLDGFTARKMKLHSELGKQLDSLADLVSFGIAPAVIVFQLLKSSLKIEHLSLNLPTTDILILISPAILIMASALRLGKFNIDTRQSVNFLGLPTPAAAAFFASLPLVKEFNPDDLLLISKAFDVQLPVTAVFVILGLQIFVMEKFYFYLPLIILFSILLLIELPMFSLKFSNLSPKTNKIKYAFISLSALLLILMQWLALPLIIVLYVLFAVVQDVVHFSSQKKFVRKDDDEPQFLARF